jgi:hypothetical protein
VTTLLGSDPLAASLFDQSAQGLIVAQEHDAWSSAGDAAPPLRISTTEQHSHRAHRDDDQHWLKDGRRKVDDSEVRGAASV